MVSLSAYRRVQHTRAPIVGVMCPHCNARHGEPCITPRGAVADLAHIERLRVLGADRPFAVTDAVPAKRRHRNSMKTHCSKGHPYDRWHVYFRSARRRNETIGFVAAPDKASALRKAMATFALPDTASISIRPTTQRKPFRPTDRICVLCLLDWQRQLRLPLHA